jgi:nucleotide-binding universal stress UspA family protein
MNRFKNILLIFEERPDQLSVLTRAVSLAETNRADLTILDVVAPGENPFQEEVLAEHKEALETLTRPFEKQVKIKTRVLAGTVFLEAIRSVLRNSHDLVIKAAENPGFLKRLFGSNDMHLLRKCPCPVWLVKLPEKSNYDCVMAAVDFDPLKPTDQEQALNREILELSGLVALSDSSALHIVHAWEAFAVATLRSRRDKAVDDTALYVEKERTLHQNGLNLQAGMLRDLIGKDLYDQLSPRLHLPNGSAKKMIAFSATELKADLVVMGTVARTGIPGFIIGNTAETILDQLDCSVIAVKPPGFITPVKLME